MNEQDRHIKDFFLEMRNADQKNPIPDFNIPQRKKYPFRKIAAVSSAAAAVVLIAVSFYFNRNENEYKSDFIELEIILTETEEANTQSLITGGSSVYSWNAPSNSLIDNFNGW